MDRDLRMLYRELGYSGSLEGSGTIIRGGRITRSAAPPPVEDDTNDLPPLDDESLKFVEKEFRKNPEKFLDDIKELRHYDIDDKLIKSALKDARSALDDPKKFVEKVREERKKAREGTKVTRGIRGEPIKVPLDLILYNDISIEPDEYKFQPQADALGWVFNSIYYIVRDKVKPNNPKTHFPLHSDYPSNFVYDLKNKDGKPAEKLSIALFADFGTGLYHSKYIARNIAALKPDYGSKDPINSTRAGLSSSRSTPWLTHFVPTRAMVRY